MPHTWNIGSWIESGEIVNTCVNQVHGWIRLAGVDRPFYLNLTGNMSSDLAGRRIRFELAPSRTVASPQQLQHLSRQQVGPTGLMTHADSLVLEWHSQDGLIVANLCPTELTLTDVCPDFTYEVFRENTLAAASLPLEPFEDSRAPWLFASLPSLEHTVAIRRGKVDEQFALLDAMLDGKVKEQPIHELLPASLKLPRASQLDPPTLQWKVKEILAHLALLGVTLDMCHHFTPRQAYNMLLDLLDNEQIHAESARSGFIVHYMSFDRCEQCLEEEDAWTGTEQPQPTPGVDAREGSSKA